MNKFEKINFGWISLFLKIVYLKNKNKKLEREKSNLSTEMQIRPMYDSDEELEQEFSGDEITESNRFIILLFE